MSVFSNSLLVFSGIDALCEGIFNGSQQSHRHAIIFNWKKKISWRFYQHFPYK